MFCDKCGKHPATTHVKKTINGKTTEMNLCAECAAEQGLGSAFGNFGFDLGDFWGALFTEPEKRAVSDTLRCPDCGRSFPEIAQIGKPGCPTCYVTFYDRLLPSIHRIHGKTQHTGKIAVQAEDHVKVERELETLKAKLAECIANQQYEQCVELRDKIQTLEKEREQA